MKNMFDSDDSHTQYKINLNFSHDEQPLQNFTTFEGQLINEQNFKTSACYSDPADHVTQLPQRNKQSKYTNPNLLKNLVTTLRSWVNIQEVAHGKIQSQMWKYFKSYKKINKHIVGILYGSINQDITKYEKLITEVPALMGISVQNFTKIQYNIKKETLNQLKNADIEYILKYRRVQNRQQFNQYFYHFVKQLEDAELLQK